MVERIANRESNSQPSNDVPLNSFRFYGEPGEENQFPVKSIEELVNLESKLVSKRFRKDLVCNYFKKLLHVTLLNYFLQNNHKLKM